VKRPKCNYEDCQEDGVNDVKTMCRVDEEQFTTTMHVCHFHLAELKNPRPMSVSCSFDIQDPKEKR
jgi:hypothetical protein